MPPRLATALLRALLPAALRAEAEDELHDLYQLRAARDGHAAADRWYYRAITGYALRLRIAHTAGEPLSEPAPRVPHRSPGDIMEGLLLDVRQALRGLRRHPGFTAIATLTLALGIGANAAIFSVVRNVLLRPLPFPEPGRLVQAWESRADRGFTQASFTHANFWDVRDLNHSFEAFGALSWGSINITGQGDAPVRLSMGQVSTGFLGALGARPLAGRVFAPGEDEPSADSKLVVLGYTLWRNRFASDTGIVGRHLTLGGASYTVIGVLPAGTPWLDAVDLFVPMVRQPNLDRGSFELTVVGRLKRGVTIEAARADLADVSRRIAEAHPEAKSMGVTLAPGETWIAGDALRRALYVLTGAVCLLLLIACVNVANLLLARATGRTREHALRAALGAGRGRIIQHALTESLLLGAFGAVGGLAVAAGIMRLLRSYDPGRIPRLADASVDLWVLAVTLLAALFTSLLAGLAPALRTPSRDIVVALRDGERSMTGSRGAGRLRSGLVSIEVALSLILLVGAGLLVRSFSALLNADRGFQTEQRVFFDVGMPVIRNDADFTRAAALQQQFLDQVRALPKVISAAAVSMVPLRGVGTGMGYSSAGSTVPTDQIPWASWRRISEDYFKSMGVPLLAGRDFGGQDAPNGQTRVILSHSIAEQLWPGQSAIGRQFIAWKGQNEVPAEVVGVVGDMRDWGLADGPSLAVYLPFRGRTWDVVNFVVHTSATPAELRPMLQATLAGLDASLPLGSPRNLEEMVGDSVAARRFTMILLTALSVLALLLALAGVYGVLSYSVSRRRPEIGVRMALGATAHSVVRLVLSQGMRPVALGVAVGIAGAIALSRFMASLLYGVTAGDALTYTTVAVLLLGAGALACWIPARGATRLDVVAALREE